VWELRKGSVSLKLPGHSNTITGLSLSPDGHHLLTNSMDNTLRVWDMRPFAPGNRWEGGGQGAGVAAHRAGGEGKGRGLELGVTDRVRTCGRSHQATSGGAAQIRRGGQGGRQLTGQEGEGKGRLLELWVMRGVRTTSFESGNSWGPSTDPGGRGREVGQGSGGGGR